MKVVFILMILILKVKKSINKKFSQKNYNLLYNSFK